MDGLDGWPSNLPSDLFRGRGPVHGEHELLKNGLVMDQRWMGRRGREQS
jgi:hypothetical protein